MDTQHQAIINFNKNNFDAETLIVHAVISDNDNVKVLSQIKSSHDDKSLKKIKFPVTTGESYISNNTTDDNSAAHAYITINEAKTNNDYRSLAGSAIRLAKRYRRVVLSFGDISAEKTYAIAEGAMLATYSFDKYKSKKPNETLEEISIISDHPIDLNRVKIINQVCSLARDLVNTPGKDLGPEEFANIVKTQAAHPALTYQEWEGEALEKAGLGGIQAVGKGSKRPPRLIKLSYTPSHGEKHIALVGKGITFDTGGLSLKPSEYMVGMHFDMAGAASVLAITLAAAELELPIKVTGWMALAENMPSGEATRPGDIVTMRGGKTVEILNTDAEGRLVMADALMMAGEENPDCIIDIATLTGAAIIALGNQTTGIMGNNMDLVHEIFDASKVVGEDSWPMPIPKEFDTVLKSKFADLQNIAGNSRGGGMLVAAAFLREFATPLAENKKEFIPWAHLDIAGTAVNEKSPYGIYGHGATAAPVRTILELISQRAS